MISIDSVIARFSKWKRAKYSAAEALGYHISFSYKNLARDISAFYFEQFRTVPLDALPTPEDVEKTIRSRAAQKAAVTRKKNRVRRLRAAEAAKQFELPL